MGVSEGEDFVNIDYVQDNTDENIVEGHLEQLSTQKVLNKGIVINMHREYFKTLDEYLEKASLDRWGTKQYSKSKKETFTGTVGVIREKLNENVFSLDFLYEDTDYKLALLESPVLLYLTAYKIDSFIETLNQEKTKKLPILFKDKKSIKEFEESLIKHLDLDKDSIFLMNQRFELFRIRRLISLTETEIEYQKYISLEELQTPDLVDLILDLLNRVNTYSEYINNFEDLPVDSYYKLGNSKNFIKEIINNRESEDIHEYIVNHLEVIYHMPFYLDIFSLENLKKSSNFEEDSNKFYNILPHKIFIKDLSALSREIKELEDDYNIRYSTSVHEWVEYFSGESKKQDLPILYFKRYMSGRTKRLIFALMDLKAKYPNLESVNLITEEGHVVSSKDKRIYLNGDKDNFITKDDNRFEELSCMYDSVVAVKYRDTEISLI